ncbi:MAG: matrixin family metalloprotease [Fibrobacterota bacterium]
MKTNIISIVIALPVLLSAYTFLGPKWPGQTPEVQYFIQEDGTPDVVNEFDAVTNAFQQWPDVEGTAITVQYMGTVESQSVAPNHKNIVKWEAGNGFNFDRNVIAVCYYWYEGTTMTDFDMVMNGRDFQWSTSGECGKMDVGRITLHEAGHALGLGHSAAASSVMLPTAAYGDVTRTLFTDDSLGIIALYPRTVVNNRAPVIVSTPVTEAVTGEKYEYQVMATDADNDPIRFKLLTMPLNMRIDSVTGLILWYPKFLDLGAHTVTVEAHDKFNARATQTFIVRVGDLVVYTPDTIVNFADTLYYPVRVTSMEGYGIYAGNIEVSYDSSKIVMLEVDTVGACIPGATLAKNITSNRVKVAFAAAEAFIGQGTLFRIKLLVHKEHCGENIPAPVVKAFFNDGDPVATTRTGNIYMKCGSCTGSYSYNIDGKVIYQANRMGVSDADVWVTVPERIEAVTQKDGYYELVKVPRTTLTFKVESAKDSGDVRDAISAYDASLILRNVVGIISLATFSKQSVCADVNNNKLITAYDAALILRYVVKYDDATFIGRWFMVSPAVEIKGLLAPRHDVNFEAYLVGDVSGNWNDFTKMPKVAAGSAGVLTLSAASEIPPVQAGGEPCQRLTVACRGTAGVYSGQMEVAFDTDHYTLIGVNASLMMNGFTLAHNVAGGKALIAFAGTQPFSGDGALFDLVLSPKAGASGSGLVSSTLSNARFNEEPSGAILVENRVAAAEGTVEGISRIFPNPFNPAVTVSFVLATRGRAVVKVYDIAGREICVLAEGLLSAGQHRVMWNSRDRRGKTVASGIYLLQFVSERKVQTHRLFLMK